MLGFSQACERNKEPILAVLKSAFTTCTMVLEIGSGTGQHAVYFGLNLPHVVWQPSELGENIETLEERVELEGTENVKSPVDLDVTKHPWPVSGFDGIFTANTLHIMPQENIEHIFAEIDEGLLPGGILCIYGPFRYNGRYTSKSNEEFDRFLKQSDPQHGIRDFEFVNALAYEHGLILKSDNSMPANNQCIVWQKQ